MPSFGLSTARAEASRRNGAKSRGPKTSEGKARSARNALKHGFRAQKHVVLPDEDAAAFAVHEAALMDELAPDGALQTVLARRIVAATWRLERAERIEAELFAFRRYADADLGVALTRDCNSARAFDTLQRYRGTALAEFWRALRTLKSLQVAAPPAVAARPVRDAIPAGPAPLARDAVPARAEPLTGDAIPRAAAPALTARPSKPKRRRNPGDGATGVAQRGAEPVPAWPVPAPTPPAETPPADQGRSGLLAGTALAVGRWSGA